MNTDGRWDPGKDFAMVSVAGDRPDAEVHGDLAGVQAGDRPGARLVCGRRSDYALCADLVIASDDAVIGTPYSRMWGAYLTGMWLYRLSLAKAKWHSLTGSRSPAGRRPPSS